MTPRARLRMVLVYAGYTLGLALLQVTWPDTLAPGGVRPDLALVVTAFAGYFYRETDGAAIGLLSGFMLDMQSGRILGLGMLLMVFAGLLPALLFRHMYQRPAWLAFTAVSASAVFFHAGTVLLSWGFPTLPDLGRNLYEIRPLILERILPAILTDAVISIPLAFLFRYAGPYRIKTKEVSA